MKVNTLIKSAVGTFNKFGFKARKHSPELLVIGGVVGVVTGAVLACSATIKARDILEESKKNIDAIHICAEDESIDYSEEDKKRELTICYLQTGAKLVKAYAPSFIIGALSITSILASNNILRKRNVALAAAYATIDRGFRDYRNRVIERFGESVDRELKYNIHKEKIEKTVIDEETGKEKKVKETVEVADINENSMYAKFFDECSREYEPDAELNIAFLRAQQQWANDKLRSQGYLFLNDVYDQLDITRTKAGQCVGWIYDPENPDHKGDNYVDFGIYNIHKKQNRKFVNCDERAILLDFNVDGNILGYLEQ